MWLCDKQATGCSRPSPKDTPAPAVIPSAGEAVIEKVWRDYVWSRKVKITYIVYTFSSVLLKVVPASRAC